MKPFVLLATRPEDVVADDEYASFLRLGGLRPQELTRVRLDRGPMPPLDLEAFSGLIVGGSPFDASKPEQLKSPVQRRVESEMAVLLDEVVERDFPFLGACYGVGTLGVHQGGVIDETFAEPVSAVTIELTDAGRADPLLTDLPSSFEAFVGHKEACRVLPSTATLLASSVTCPVQMFRVRQNLYATQFHPELDIPAIVTRIQVYRNHGYFSPEETESVIEGVRKAKVSVASRVLEAFVARYAQA